MKQVFEWKAAFEGERASLQLLLARLSSRALVCPLVGIVTDSSGFRGSNLISNYYILKIIIKGFDSDMFVEF